MSKQNVHIKQIEKKDFPQAMTFAEEGMHFSWYVDNKLELAVYRRYAFYQVLLKSTTVLGAYVDNELAGFLFAGFKDEQVIYDAWHYRLYCKAVEKGMDLLGYDEASNAYDRANQEMLEEYAAKHSQPDGELTFFAVDPEKTGNGIGSLLLEELTKRHKGKTVYLYSDSGSTYEFYLRRGFDQAGKRDIVVPVDKHKEVPLTCYLFSKRL